MKSTARRQGGQKISRQDAKTQRIQSRERSGYSTDVSRESPLHRHTVTETKIAYTLKYVKCFVSVCVLRDKKVTMPEAAPTKRSEIPSSVAVRQLPDPLRSPRCCRPKRSNEAIGMANLRTQSPSQTPSRAEVFERAGPRRLRFPAGCKPAAPFGFLG